ncbi:glycosyltransferase family 4 protein [Streptomyces radiopugnans]|uniref:glycosyltransferase family 4 protein n=1 Tax=Streptomyces radiopugnans TaxID=403935 RepID=UPI003F19CF90
MNTPSVCFVLRHFTVGGLERVVSLLANQLAALGVSVRVVVLGTARRNALITELDDAVDVHVLSGPWPARLQSVRELARGRVVHLHFGDGRIHPSVRWALRDHPEVVVTYHSVYSHKRTRPANRLDRLVTSRCRRVVAVSEAVSRFCTEEVGLPAGLVTVIRNAVPESGAGAFTRTERVEGGLDLVALASVYPHKNHVSLIRGVAALRARGHDVRLRVIGDGPQMAQAFQTAKEMNIASAIDWYGAVWKREIVGAVLRSSDVFVSASRYEGLPLSVLEGLRAGLPMVLSDIDAHRETAGDAAVYFPADDAEAFADGVQSLLDAGDRAAYSKAAVERSQVFSVERFVARHVELYASFSAQPWARLAVER